MSPEDKNKALKGELGQANYLIEAKERNSDIKNKFLKSKTNWNDDWFFNVEYFLTIYLNFII